MTDPLFGKSVWKSTELEKDFQARVVELLVLHGWNVFSIPDSRRVTIKGYPDLTCWGPKGFFWAELKREKGRLSPEQKLVHEQLRPTAKVFVWKPSNFDEIVEIAKKGPNEP